MCRDSSELKCYDMNNKFGTWRSLSHAGGLRIGDLWILFGGNGSGEEGPGDTQEKETFKLNF